MRVSIKSTMIAREVLLVHSSIVTELFIVQLFLFELGDFLLEFCQTAISYVESRRAHSSRCSSATVSS